MSLDKNTVQSIAQLAKLRIDDSQIEKYADELSNILNLVEQMDAADTDGIEPMTHPFDATLRMRLDEVSETDQRDKFHALAPESENGLYVVPKVID